MSRFSIRNPYLIVVICLVVTVVGVSSVVRLPVDMFPAINIPTVVVATFYSGMPPQQIEADITSRFERFFTLASNIDHIESRSLPGVSIIRVFFQPGTNADSAVATISNLAMAQLRRLPPGTLPPVVLKFDASSLPVCLVTVKGAGMNEAALRDQAQFNIRNQIANVPGASVPPPFGGRYRQIMVYVDPGKLEAYQLSPMDVVRAVNDSNLILPAGDVRIGPYDYNIYTNSQLSTMADINSLPIKAAGSSYVRVADVGAARDAHGIQYNIVRIDGQPSVYLPVLKQGGDTNTIAVVEGIRSAITKLLDTPKQLVTSVVFDQAKFVRQAIETLIHEGALGLLLTSLMILIFLGSMRATVAVFLSIPLSALATFICLQLGGSSINTMILGGLALAFSRLIDNSVVVLENIYRHLEMGDAPEVAAEVGGREVALPVLSATLTTVVVFFPVTFLYGVSKFLFSALALAVVLSLFASYFVAMSVVPLFCARFLKTHEHIGQPKSFGDRFNNWFNAGFEKMLRGYDVSLARGLRSPRLVIGSLLAVFVASLAIYPSLGMAFFPRTDAGQFVINLKAPAGTRLELTNGLVAGVENQIRRVVSKRDLDMIVSNVGSTPGLSAVYNSNSAQHTAFVQVSLKDGHKVPSQEYMRRVRLRLAREMPEISTYFQSGSLVDAVLNLGLAAPIDVQVSGSDLNAAYRTASRLRTEIARIAGVSDAFIPQDLDNPALQINVDRTRANAIGLSQKEVVSNVITALTSNGMIAPSYWIDPKTGNDYLLTVQYPENIVKTISDLRSIPLRASGQKDSTTLDTITDVHHIVSPTEVDHYQLRRIIDIYVGLAGEDLGHVANTIDRIVSQSRIPNGVLVDMRGMVQGMRTSFKSFAIGLLMALVLLYLILVAQFGSFIDPFLIMLAVPLGLTGVIVTLYLTGTTLNVQSLMGMLMMVGIVVSNSILIVEFAHRLEEQGRGVREAVALSCRIRLRPILMTSLATLIGLMPMALKMGAGSEAYAPLARAILGGLAVSLVTTVYLVPAAYILVYGRKEARG